VLKGVADQMPAELTLDQITSAEVIRGRNNQIKLQGDVKSGQNRQVGAYVNKLASIDMIDPVSRKPRKLFQSVTPVSETAGAAGGEGPGRWTIICLIHSNTPLK
jgi:hypothetical protein